MNQNTVVVKILDKEYQVACPTDEQAPLMRAAQHLDQQMRHIRTSGKVIGLERIAVMAALNISYELLTVKAEGAPNKNEAATVERISERIEETLQHCRQLEIS
ncbi:cell division protein ZapA [Spongiibacter sp. IMCC21906]|uniref:cell division protein ZapA n=1 Tax=Spongiibacter sp. IMCC21906 TaxID=1620392 RepID=UPI00062DF271|nr:cell division protein ZapA [Spongiibacter sp. IMCC21906]AKH68474.1 cell division protein ZapA [Spongiibacter sp. IMCC21906]